MWRRTPGAGGVGTHLLDALLHASESHGIWTLQAGVFPENEASLAIHAAAGFRVVGGAGAAGTAGRGVAGTWSCWSGGSRVVGG